MLHEIKLLLPEIDMQKLILSLFLILVLVPFSQAFSQEYSDTGPTLSVSLRDETPYVYQDSEGYTVVVGTVENNNSLASITNVIIHVNFFDNFGSNPLEVMEGRTILEVIPPNGKSPFVIRSETPNPNITEASISLLGFNSSVAKEKLLTVFSSEVFLDSSLHFSGVLQNGGTPISDTNVYLAFYDVFGRILGVSTIEIGDVDLNGEIAFEFNEPIDFRSVGLLLFSESDKFYSDFVDVTIPPSQVSTKLVTISDVTVEDSMGNKLSEIKMGTTVNIKSETWIQFSADQKSDETAYTYYVQIKESGTSPFVEYIGKFDGRFIGTGTESQTIDWIPEKKGLFFIETFVWDRNNVPIAEQGPFVLIIVN
jgi:hypothetical protein